MYHGETLEERAGSVPVAGVVYNRKERYATQSCLQ